MIRITTSIKGHSRDPFLYARLCNRFPYFLSYILTPKTHITVVTHTDNVIRFHTPITNIASLYSPQIDKM
ncbi:hypothetical protein Hanom_Chr10g00922161 [Helianthus anomalus]